MAHFPICDRAAGAIPDRSLEHEDLAAAPEYPGRRLILRTRRRREREQD